MQPFTKHRESFQHGSLTLENRAKGGPVWVYRWRDTARDGSRVRRKAIVGTKHELPTKAKAQKAAASLRLEVAKEQPGRVRAALSVADLAAHYRAKELVEHTARKAFSTRQCYQVLIDKHILPRWGTYQLGEVRTVAVEDWLGELDMADASKAKIRNVFHALYSHAERYEWHDRNPITKVRQSAKRQKEPDILDAGELCAMLTHPEEPYRSMMFLAAATGLRRGEIMGLKWEDIDFQAQSIYPRRSVVQQRSGPVKTAASAKPVPLDPHLGEVLAGLKAETFFDRPGDWVFASPASRYRKPYWPDMVLRWRIRPLARSLGIAKQIGWHTFRRSFTTLLNATGADVKVMQELARHANPGLTLKLYVQALTPNKRAAQSAVVELIRPKLLPASTVGVA